MFAKRAGGHLPTLFQRLHCSDQAEIRGCVKVPSMQLADEPTHFVGDVGTIRHNSARRTRQVDLCHRVLLSRNFVAKDELHIHSVALPTVSALTGRRQVQDGAHTQHQKLPLLNSRMGQSEYIARKLRSADSVQRQTDHGGRC